jgi:hypothetical protein
METTFMLLLDRHWLSRSSGLVPFMNPRTRNYFQRTRAILDQEPIIKNSLMKNTKRIYRDIESRLW